MSKQCHALAENNINEPILRVRQIVSLGPLGNCLRMRGERMAQAQDTLPQSDGHSAKIGQNCLGDILQFFGSLLW